MDNQRAIQLLQAHIDAEDMPLFSQAAAIGIRAIKRVAALEAELAEARRNVSDHMDVESILAREKFQLATLLAEARKDGERLDWLELRRRALNQHYGTSYGWKFVSSSNVTRLFVKDVNTIDLSDAESRAGDIRAAIDAARAAEGGKG